MKPRACLLTVLSSLLLGCGSEHPEPIAPSATKTQAALALPSSIPMDIMGLTIGESFDLPRCVKREDFRTPITCWQKTHDDEKNSKTLPLNAALDVYFADSVLPAGIYGLSDVVVMDGKLFDISLTTMDSEQESIYKMLEKNGVNRERPAFRS